MMIFPPSDLNFCSSSSGNVWPENDVCNNVICCMSWETQQYRGKSFTKIILWGDQDSRTFNMNVKMQGFNILEVKCLCNI